MQLVDISKVHGRDWVDYSSLSTFMRCPRQYFWRYVNHFTPNYEKRPLIYGSAFHESKAGFYEAKMNGADHEEAVEYGLRLGIPIIREIQDPDDKHNESCFIKTYQNYCEVYRHDADKTLMVEVPFAMEMGSYLMVGKIDRVKEGMFGVTIEETKTAGIVGKKWALRVNPNMQADTYFTAHYVMTGEVGGAIELDVVPKTTYDKIGGGYYAPFRHPGIRNMDDINLWADDVQEWLKSLDYCKQNGIYPRNTETCHPMLGFNCDYPLLCRKYKHPHLIDQIELPAEYKIEQWHPYDELKEIKQKGVDDETNS